MILSHYSVCVVMAVLLLSGACAAVVFTLHDLPLFDDPIAVSVLTLLAIFVVFLNVVLITLTPPHTHTPTTLTLLIHLVSF